MNAVVIEDQDMLRALLSEWLTTKEGCNVIGEYRTVADASANIETIAKQADLLIVDVNLPDGDGVEISRRILELAKRDIGTVVISGQHGANLFQRLSRDLTGGWAFLLKNSNSLSKLHQAIQAVSEGLVMVDPQLQRQPGTQTKASLTQQEQDVMLHVAAGKSNAVVAQEIFMSEKSVERLLGGIYQKFGVEGTSKQENPRVRATLIFLGLAPQT